MSSFHIVCNKRINQSKKRLKVFTWYQPLRTRARKGTKVRKLQVLHLLRNNKSDRMEALPVSFVIRVETRRRIVPSITLGV